MTVTRKQYTTDRAALKRVVDAIKRAARELRHLKAVRKRRVAQVRHDEAALRAAVARGNLGAFAVREGLRWAAQGVTEHPAYSNDGPTLRAHFPQFGWQPGWAWCQYFVDYLIAYATRKHRIIHDGYTPDIVAMARRRENGFRLVWERGQGGFVPVGRGLLRYYNFGAPEFCQHVGMDIGDGTTIEGNTSSGNAGSQDNGGGCYHRNRGTANVVAVVDWDGRV